MITFPLIYIILLVGSIVAAYRKERKTKRAKEPVTKQVEQITKQVEEDTPLPACFTIEWDLDNGGSKITVDE